jgi:hypothetical protein
MENQQLTQLIRRELPGILRRDREMREWVLELTRERYADKNESESRFDQMLDELRRDREENTRKWEEQNRKWEENTARLDRMLDAIEAQAKKHDRSIGALGARWGLQTEQAFRNALVGILGTSFGVEVLNVTEFDDAGEVFGRPEQVELDIIIQDGLLILCEIKSSISKAEMYIFERKVAFYEKRHERKATRKLAISPMVEERARAVAAKLGIEVYSYAEDVTP